MKTFIKIIILAGITAIALAGCNMGDVQSKEECLEDFFGKAQSSQWTSMYEEIHPDNPNRDSYKSGTLFNTLYNPEVTYSIVSKSGDTYTVNVNPDGYGSAQEIFVFRAEEGDGLFEGDEWLIYSFTDSTTGTH